LYGFGEVDTKKVNDLIKLMELDKKTQYVDGKFTETNLSTGQRKRLALIAAFLEDKPIYMFDEVAADQDPEFRAYFYNELLLDLKKRGKTVIAATHDDKYFHVADRVLKMEYGKIQSI
ncbi:MAG: AAA family ATPase, partial [Candidatus Scalindua sp.]|nr:AAA family ATPase [Candidatus Scalindua sp.]